jgi:hypothetical protein
MFGIFNLSLFELLMLGGAASVVAVVAVFIALLGTRRDNRRDED